MLVSNNFRFKPTAIPGHRRRNFLSPLRNPPDPPASRSRPRARGDITAPLPDVTGARTHSTLTSSPTGAGPQPTSASPEAKAARKVKAGRQLTCAAAGRAGGPSPSGRDRARRPPPRARLPHRPLVPAVGEPVRRLLTAYPSSPRLQPGRGPRSRSRPPVRPTSVARRGAQRRARVRLEAGPGRGAGRRLRPQTRPQRRAPRTRGRHPRPHPPRVLGAQASGGRGRGTATVAVAEPRPRCPSATPRGPDPPALLPRPRPGPGLHTPMRRRRRREAWLAPHR